MQSLIDLPPVLLCDPQFGLRADSPGCSARGASSFWRGVRRVYCWFEARSDQVARLGRYGAALFLFAALVHALALSGEARRIVDQMTDEANAMTAHLGFAVKTIVIEGRRNLSEKAVREVLAPAIDHSIFAFDTQEARAALKRKGWVDDAQVLRLWPSTLIVKLRERAPAARWLLASGEWLIDEAGAPIAPASPDFAHLPLVAGPGANDQAEALLALLRAHQRVARRVLLAERIERRRWDLRLKDGLRVKLPETGADAALELLGALLASGRLPIAELAAVDLRIAGRVVLKLRDTSDEASRLMAGRLRKMAIPRTAAAPGQPRMGNVGTTRDTGMGRL